MSELTWILDPATGELTVEGLSEAEASALAGDLLPPARPLNCARPLTTQPLPSRQETSGLTLRVAHLYHGSVVDGPGRRSVVQTQGCVHQCRGCALTETHSLAGGVALGIEAIVAALLDAQGEPRDGITVTGGEPFLQPVGLLALLQRLKAHDLHTVVYTGFTLEALACRLEPEVQAALKLIDVLIDGPFVARLSDGAGEWRGSRNQRVIHRPGALMEVMRSDRLQQK
ncbi:MAG: radical SAM protein [Anaerolineae bacterium]|nr:radical SAM protein [Anaerolineae bacterium]